MRILIFTLSWSFDLHLDQNWKVLIFGKVAKRTLSVCQAYAESHGNIFNCSKTVCMTFKAKSAKEQSPHYWHMGGKLYNLLITTNIWELFWILSSQMTKTFRDNCDKNIVQQTSCEPHFPDVQMQLKMYFFVPFGMSMYAWQLWRNFRKTCMQRLRVAYNFGCRALYNLPWRASVSSHDSSDSM